MECEKRELMLTRVTALQKFRRKVRAESFTEPLMTAFNGHSLIIVSFKSPKLSQVRDV